jgi:hypothetical protein
MKKKFTRKIRKNKRSTQRRKNRSYKRMRGGAKMMFKQRKKIMKLLKNLIINNLTKDSIIELCNKQQTSITPTATEQPLLQPVLLEHIEEIDELIKKTYNDIISKNIQKKYQFSFDPDDRYQKRIIEALRPKEITYFDRIDKYTVLDILSPIDFERSFSSSIWFRQIMISDTLVYSMFAFSVKFVSVMDTFGGRQIVYTVDPFKCP